MKPFRLVLVLSCFALAASFSACKDKTQDTDQKKEYKQNSLQKETEPADAEAQFKLGNRYAVGDGVEQNFAEAAKWYRKAADQGVEQAKAALERLAAE